MRVPSGCVVIIFLFNLLLGGWSFDYCLWSIFGKDVPFYMDMLCGLFVGQFTIPLAVVCLLLRCCGVEVPFFH